MKKSKLTNLELVHLNIWLNIMNKYGNRICSRWTDSKMGYYNFKKDSYKQFLNHVEQFGVYKTFVKLENVNGMFSPTNCFWSIEKQDLSNCPLKKGQIKNLKQTKKQKKRKKQNRNNTTAKILNFTDFKKKE